MVRTKKQVNKEEVKAETVAVTRAEKKDATKNLIKEVLAIKPMKHNELIDATAKLYSERFGADTDNVNDVKGRVGSVLDIMKKDGEVANDGGMYALKSRLPIPAPVAEAPKTEEIKPEKPAKKTAKKSAKKTEKAEESAEVKTEEKPVKKTTKKSSKAKKEEVTPTAEAVAEVVPETIESPVAEVTEKAVEPAPAEEKSVKKTAKKTTKKTTKKEKKAEEIPVETPVEEPAKGTETAVETQEQPQEKTEEKPVVKNPPVVKEKAEIAPKTEVMDMSFLFGSVKPAKVEKTEKIEQKPVEKTEKSVEKTEQKPEAKPQVKAEENSVVLEEKTPEVKTEKTVEKPVEKTVKTPVQKVQMPTVKPVQIPAQNRVLKTVKRAEQKPMNAEEKLRDNFLKKLRSLGGDYFEYYSVYLLEKYSRKNGRRLESLKISGGERDGGIDGEIELTDRLGFRETIYIQSKNWDPDRGNERLWVVGETLLQQFIGACACKQAKDGKQHARGIFITTSNFTPEAKRVLDMMSDKVVGYDGNDLFDAAKECQFGLIYENGNWKLDEKLLSGTKAFFNM